MKKYLFLFFILLVISVSVLLFKKGHLKFTDNFFLKKDTSEYSLELKGTTIFGWKDGKKQWEIKAEKIYVSEDERYNEFHNIYSGNFFKDKKVVATFTAQKGVWDKITNNLEIEGNIKLKSEDITFETEKIIYTGYNKKLTSITPVKFTLKNGYVICEKIIAHQDMEEIELFKNVGEFKVEEKEIKEKI